MDGWETLFEGSGEGVLCWNLFGIVYLRVCNAQAWMLSSRIEGGGWEWLLIMCVNSYRTTLNKLENWDDDDGMLSRCHTRCAKR